MFSTLNLPPYPFKIEDDRIWDRLRKKYVKITPEEWVRQHFIAYLIEHLEYNEGLMSSEQEVKYNGMSKRCDIAVYSNDMRARIIVECKAPDIRISQDTFYQIAKYNQVLQAPVLILTNGMDHYCALINYTDGSLQFLDKIPTKRELALITD